VQGRLRDEELAVSIKTSCAHCDEPIHIDLDSELSWTVKESDADPLVFEPRIDWGTFRKPNIIDDY
jgi:hypothetical protein